ncbi:proteinase [Pseudomonas sp. CFBP13528]|uniref:alpha/beta fold hydrolase n=1 Tax=Pseudomonas sp. CFBP13528 TaxID=2184006 RepID=UPI0010BFC11C|nr:alpha/beta fold hydrolase [Pseudomonas sp. CFBP13528]TKK32748.1 proteinase [Pseudomonas sp. CFBP13528]
MKPSVVGKCLVCLGGWLIAHLALADPLIAPTAIDWLLDCPFPVLERLAPDVLDRTQCGLVTVPRDHAAPGRGRIRLSVTRVGARDPLNREGVVFIQSGEPHTAKNATFALHLASLWESYANPAYRKLVDRYDMIELSSRDLTGGDALEQAAQDMEYVRGQLGESRLNYVGNADAARLGNRYATRFPERVARMVLVNAGHSEPGASGVESLLLKEPAQTTADGCVSRWLGEFLAYGKQPPTSTRCLDRGGWE